jgi:hypothetical protein
MASFSHSDACANATYRSIFSRACAFAIGYRCAAFLAISACAYSDSNAQATKGAVLNLALSVAFATTYAAGP